MDKKEKIEFTKEELKELENLEKYIQDILDEKDFTEDNNRIKELINKGHTDHCAKRIVWGDGECECQLKGIIPGKISKEIIKMNKEQNNIEFKISKLRKWKPSIIIGKRNE